MLIYIYKYTERIKKTEQHRDTLKMACARNWKA